MPLRVQELLDRAGESITVRRAFGTAYEQDGVLVIPVAWVAGGAGAGAADSEDTAGNGEGGGYGAVAWPLGVYVVQGGDVRWVPALDATRVALSAMALVRGLVKLRKRRSKRA